MGRGGVRLLQKRIQLVPALLNPLALCGVVAISSQSLWPYSVRIGGSLGLSRLGSVRARPVCAFRLVVRVRLARLFRVRVGAGAGRRLLLLLVPRVGGRPWGLSPRVANNPSRDCCELSSSDMLENKAYTENNAMRLLVALLPYCADERT